MKVKISRQSFLSLSLSWCDKKCLATAPRQARRCHVEERVERFHHLAEWDLTKQHGIYEEEKTLDFIGFKPGDSEIHGIPRKNPTKVGIPLTQMGFYGGFYLERAPF